MWEADNSFQMILDGFLKSSSLHEFRVGEMQTIHFLLHFPQLVKFMLVPLNDVGLNTVTEVGQLRSDEGKRYGMLTGAYIAYNVILMVDVENLVSSATTVISALVAKQDPGHIRRAFFFGAVYQLCSCLKLSFPS
ncbi:hypothetical protein VNO77_20050 [Canavalia gladiata]|uniref:Uncharacterized protein n=1 Tax=Canavalia gladiata TaxID=3824 RepID=A0AAN9LNR3_CANGL